MKSVNGITSVVNTINPVPTITVGKFDLFEVTAVNEKTNTPYSLVSQFGKNGIELDNIKAKMQDILSAEGYRACNFDRSDKSEIAVKFHDQIKSMFIAQMPVDARELLAKPTKGLNDMQKANRAYLTNRVSTLFGNLYKAMQKMEEEEVQVTAETTVSGKSVPVTGNQLICRTIMEQVSKLQAIKTPCEKNVEIIKGLNAIVKMFNDCGIVASIKK